MGDILLFDGSGDVRPWYTERDLVAHNEYDTPDGQPLAATDEDLLAYMEEEFNQPFTGEMTQADFVFARMLPENTYVPVDDVIAVLRSAVLWSRAINVSWMQMDFDPLLGAEVPIQHHRRGGALMYVHARQCTDFGVASPSDTDGPVRIALDCVTDIGLAMTVVPVAQLPTGVQTDG